MNTFFRLLTALFPRGFRERFGDEVVERAVGEVRRAWRRGLLPGLVAFVANAGDLVWAALMERIQPTPVPGSDDHTRREGWTMMVEAWMGELKTAARALLKAPGFLVAAVGTLALALGANAGMFSAVEQVLVDPLPFEESDRLVYIAASAPGSDLQGELPVGLEFYLQYSQEADQLESLATYNSFTATMRVGDRAERVRMSMPTASLFRVLRGSPALGRLPTEEDGSDVVVLTHAAWASWFGSDPGVIGQAHYFMDRTRTIIGVMPPDFRFPDDGTLLWIPREVETENIQVGRFGINLVGRLAPGADQTSLTRQLDVLARRLPERFGGSAAYQRFIEQHVPVVRPLKDQVYGEVAGAMSVLLASVALVLLIACANVANLFSVRFEGRGRDLAVRKALGAGRGQLMRSLMAEALFVAALAGAGALALAAAATPVFVELAPADVSRFIEPGVSPTTVAFTLAATLLAALVCGLVPALRASRPELDRLRDGVRGSTVRNRWGRDALVVFQTALALILLIGSGLLFRSFSELRSVDPGYETDDLFTFQFAPEQEHLVDGPSWARFHQSFMDRLRALPGVQSVGIVENVPLNEGLLNERFVAEGAEGEDDGSRVGATFAGGDYFRTMGIEVLRGRPLDERDLTEPGNAVVSESTARALWPEEDPVGRRLRAAGGQTWYTVVGVVEDVLQYDLRTAGDPMIYLPMVGPVPDAWALSSPGYVVKTPRAAAIAPEIRALVREVAPEAPMYRTFTMEELARRSMAELSFTMITLAVAAGLALVLGAVGLYGTLAYAVSRRTREIGVRMALGAEASRVRRMVVAQGGRVVLVGVVLGMGAAVAGSRALGSLLFGVEPLDPGVFLAMSGFMILVGIAASWVPARRASAVAPSESMREG